MARESRALTEREFSVPSAFYLWYLCSVSIEHEYEQKQEQE